MTGTGVEAKERQDPLRQCTDFGLKTGCSPGGGGRFPVGGPGGVSSGEPGAGQLLP